MNETQQKQVPFIKKWLQSMRPWSFPASTMPVIFGTSLAVVYGNASLNVPHFLLALLAMVILHSAANMLSDVYDYKKGLDKMVTPVSGGIVRGWITTRQATTRSIVLFALGIALGLVLVFLTGKTLLIIGAVGVVIGIFYAGLKYHALGDLAVFLNFGILGSLGAWVVQTKTFSWIPIIWTIPMAMLVAGILHANNWRDSLSDKEKKVRTIANLIGDKLSLAYYGKLIFGSIFFILLLIAVPRLIHTPILEMPLTFLLCLLAVPNALKLWGRAKRRHNPRLPMDFVILDGATANHNLIFGLLCIAAVWFDFILKQI
ncbi:MAG: prenyltransferase [Acidobacteria bacterium]|nr:prenyltransferase [Acidobacteriota bacterium]MBU1339653.1 prenyltransferase [Acidobacteriota bacterium]